MRWNISIFSADGKKLIFAAQTRNGAEAHKLAAEARRLRPTIKIFLHAPTGEVTELA